MFPLSGLLGGLAVGGAKSLLIDAPRERRERKMAGATTRYSPWTGLKADPINYANPLGSMIEGGVQGMDFQQNLEDADLRQKWLDEKLKRDALINKGLERAVDGGKEIVPSISIWEAMNNQSDGSGTSGGMGGRQWGNTYGVY